MADIYISPTGNDSTGDGSNGNPYKTVFYVLNNHEADGVVIKCKPGTYDDGVWYTGFFVATGTITIESSTGDADDVIHEPPTTNGLIVAHPSVIGRTVNIKNMIIDCSTHTCQGDIIKAEVWANLNLTGCLFIGGGHATEQFYVCGNGSSGYTSTMTAYDNTFSGAGNTAIYLTQNNHGIVNFRNNIFIDCDYGIDRANVLLGTYTIDYNCYYNNGTDTHADFTGEDTNSFFADPDLDGSYHIDNTSNCFDTGIYIAGVNDGYEGAAPDIGYYEHIINSPPTAPTNLTVVAT